MDLRGRSERIVSVASDGKISAPVISSGWMFVPEQSGCIAPTWVVPQAYEVLSQRDLGQDFFYLLFQERNEEDVRRRNTMAMASAADAASKKSTKQ